MYFQWVQENSIIIPDNTNITPKNYFEIINRHYPAITEIKIGEECTSEQNSLDIHGFRKLQKISVGNNSLTQSVNSYSSRRTSKVTIMDCDCLKEIYFGCYSFSSSVSLRLESKHIYIGMSQFEI